MNISDWIAKWADFTPRKTAIRFEGKEISYGELSANIARLAAGLKNRLGVAPGDRIAHLGYNSPEMLILLFACARLGAMLAPLNWRLAAPEHRYILRQSGARCLFADRSFQGHVAALNEDGRDIALICVDAAAPDAGWTDFATLARESAHDTPVNVISDNSPLLIVYTSGTTGKPKGAVLTQNALLWNAINSMLAHDLRSSDHILTTLPMFHVGGLNILTTPALHAGATVTLHRKFDAAATLREIAKSRPTLTVMVPAQMQAASSHPEWGETDLKSLRMLTTGSSIVPKPVIAPWHDRGIPVVQVYGSTETAPIAIHQRADDAMTTAGSTGKPAVHCEVRLIDKQGNDVATGQCGEILVRGRNVMVEYWGDREATAEALRGGWHYTGDIGYRDEDGNYHVVDRKKDMIVSGGENIYPAELEAVLYEHPDIAEAAVVGRADRNWGEVAVAVIGLRAGRRLAKPEVLALFDDRLARFKHPKDVIFVKKLPRNAMGKILKFKTRQMLTGRGKDKCHS
ncbi:MAG: long-chain fatty acid--CoA ligase [Sphingomonadales bacterium]